MSDNDYMRVRNADFVLVRAVDQLAKWPHPPIKVQLRACCVNSRAPLPAIGKLEVKSVRSLERGSAVSLLATECAWFAD